jgi:hypothetical protein
LSNGLELFKCNVLTFRHLEKVGTFNVDSPLELRDNAASTAFGGDGFNPPSSFSTRYHAPYRHRGRAQILPEVFPLHGLGPGEVFPSVTTIATVLTAKQRQDLLVFLNVIDGTTDQLRSAGDIFRGDTRTQVPPYPQP